MLLNPAGASPKPKSMSNTCEISWNLVKARVTTFGGRKGGRTAISHEHHRWHTTGEDGRTSRFHAEADEGVEGVMWSIHIFIRNKNKNVESP